MSVCLEKALRSGALNVYHALALSVFSVAQGVTLTLFMGLAVGVHANPRSLDEEVQHEELEAILEAMSPALDEGVSMWATPWQEPVQLNSTLISVARQDSARLADTLPEGWESEERWRAWRALKLEAELAWSLSANGALGSQWRTQMELQGPAPRSHTWPGGSAGFLLNAPRLKDGPLWDTRRYKNYATPEAITAIKAGVYALHSAIPDAPTTIIGDLSKRYGGHFPPHLSHQSGRDADIGYFVRGPLARKMKGLMQTSYRQLDAEATWAFLEGMLKTGLIDQIYIDHRLQRKLYRSAKRGGLSAARLKEWFSYPFKRGGVIRHLKGHADHMHVRFKAPSSEAAGAALVRAEGARSLRPRPRYARVRRGDTLARISKRHRVPLSALSKWNRLPRQANAHLKRRSVIVGFHTPWHLAQR